MPPTEAPPRRAPARDELFVLGGASREGLAESADAIRRIVQARPQLSPLDLAFTLSAHPQEGPHRLSIVATSTRELARKLEHAATALRKEGIRRIRERSGIYWFDRRLAEEGKVAFVFPGEGAQYPNMLSGLCMEFPEARACFDRIDRVFADHERGYLPSQFIFPREAGEEDRLWQMDGAVEAVFTANSAIHAVLGRLGIRPAMIVGHSTGDYSALMASGCLPVGEEEDLLGLMLDLNGLYQTLEKKGRIPHATLVAVGSVEPGAARKLVEQSGGDIHLAMDNCPHQFVLAGTAGSLEPVTERLRREGAILEILPFSRAYHTPGFEPVCRDLMPFYGRLPVRAPRVETWSAATAAPLPPEPEAIRRISVAQWAQPVRFTETVEAMHQAGARIFVEVGPRGNLTAFITDILRRRPHLAVPADLQQRTGIAQLLHLAGMLWAHGVPVDLTPLFERRGPSRVDLDDGAAPARARRQMSLATGWPEMRLTEETARRIRERLHGTGESASPAPRETREPIKPPGSASDPVPAPQAGGLPEGHARDLMEAHFRTMEKFLEVQDEVMRAALAGDSVRSRPARATAGPAEEPRPARLGMDSGAPDAAKDPGEAERGKPAAPAPETGPPASPASPPRASQEGVREVLVRLVSDRTGYPPEMIDLDLDLEADLGIDSIKRVEILGSFQKETGLAGAGDMERLQGRKTLREIVEAVAPAAAGGAPAPPAPVSPAAGDREGAPEPPAGTVGPAKLPFLDRVTVHHPGRSLTARVAIRRDGALFLRHHCLGREVSRFQGDLSGLPVVPLTMTMEILAEAAAALAPGKVVTGMREVRGHRWLVLSGESLDLDVKAEMAGEGVHVRIFDGTGAETALPLAEGTVLVADGYAPASAPPPAAMRGERPSRWRNDRLYRDVMFHGPVFQGVVSMDLWGEDGARATLRSLPREGHFRGEEAPAYVTDPVLLDQPGQVVGFWTADHLKRGYVVFPFRLEALDLHGPPPGPGEIFQCRAAIELKGEDQVRSDLEVADGRGALHARLTGWWDRRFDLPRPFVELLLSPEEAFVGRPWPSAEGGPPAAGGIHGSEVDTAVFPEGFFQDLGGFWAEVLARVVLGREERRQWRGLSLPQARKVEWLLGRVAAKEAARRLLLQRHGLRLPPADVEVVKDGDGRPSVAGAWTSGLAEGLAVSLSHSDGVAVALVGPIPQGSGNGAAPHGIGVDVERLGRIRGELAGLAFSEEEQRLFRGLTGDQREEWALRCWCAKEAVAKALGTGMMGNPRNLIAQKLDIATGSVDVTMAPAMAGLLPQLGSGAIAARTWRDKDRIYGASTCERSIE